jgi:hypothetical protein
MNTKNERFSISAKYSIATKPPFKCPSAELSGKFMQLTIAHEGNLGPTLHMDEKRANCTYGRGWDA